MTSNENFQNLKKKILEKRTLPQIKIPVSKEQNSLKDIMPLMKNSANNSGNNSGTNSGTNSGNGNDINKKKLFEDTNKTITKTEQEKNKKKDVSVLDEEIKEIKEMETQEEMMSSSADFKRICFIGQGTSGLVEKALYIPQNLIVALKSIPLNSDETFKKQLYIELNTLRSCQCDYIVKCYSAYFDQATINIALEYMDIGTLSTILKAVGKVEEPILGLITYQVLKGLDYLHRKMKVIHRDIKPSNLLLNSKGQIKIADFGVSGKMLHTNDSKSSWVGTLMYMSPERFRGEHYNSNTDIWSLGLTIMECALGHYPYKSPAGDFNKITFWELLETINSKPIPHLDSKYSDDFKDFISKCLKKDPKTRANAAELLKHNFVKDYEDMSLHSFAEWLKII